MNESTQLERAKVIATQFLHLPIETGEFSPVVVYHPFFQSSILTDDNGFFDAFEEKERYDKLKIKIEEMIKDSKTLIDILALIRPQYCLTYLKFCNEMKVLTNKDCGNLISEFWHELINIEYDVNVSQAKVLRWIKTSDKTCWMDKEDLEVFEHLPEAIDVYRTCNDSKDTKSVSWYTNLDYVEDLALEYDKKIMAATINKHQIIVTLKLSDEITEILLDYNYLNNIHILD